MKRDFAGALVFHLENETTETLKKFFTNDNKKIKINARALTLIEQVLQEESTLSFGPETVFRKEYAFQGSMEAFMGTTRRYMDPASPEGKKATRKILVILKLLLESEQTDVLGKGTGNWFGWFQLDETTKGLLCVYNSVHTVDSKIAVLSPVVQIDLYTNLSGLFGGTFPVAIF